MIKCCLLFPLLQAKQKQELPSLLGDPMTAQADIILKNIILPSNDMPEYPPLEKEDEPRLLGRPIRKLSLAFVQRLGSLMAMFSEKNNAKGLLGMSKLLMFIAARVRTKLEKSLNLTFVLENFWDFEKTAIFHVIVLEFQKNVLET